MVKSDEGSDVVGSGWGGGALVVLNRFGSSDISMDEFITEDAKKRVENTPQTKLNGRVIISENIIHSKAGRQYIHSSKQLLTVGNGEMKNA